MLADAECDLRIRTAADVELERLLENFFVAVRRRIKQAYRFPSFDLLAANHRVFGRGPRELNNRRRPAHDLFHRRVDQPGIALELLPLGRMLDESQQAAGGRVARGLVAGHHQQEIVRQHLELRYRLAIDLAVGDDAGDVVGRVLHPFHHHVGEILEQPQPRTIHRLLRARPGLELGVAAANRLVGPSEELFPILVRNAQQLGDHGERILRRYLGVEVALVAPGHVVEHLARNPLDLRLQRLHLARRKTAAQDRAIVAVFRRIHVEQMAERRRRTALEPVLVDKHQQAGTVEEQPRLLGNLNDVGVLGDRPKWVGLWVLVPENRFVLAQIRPLAMRIAVFLVMVGSNDVQRFQ